MKVLETSIQFSLHYPKKNGTGQYRCDTKRLRSTPILVTAIRHNTHTIHQVPLCNIS
jgi:hypothetical protein